MTSTRIVIATCVLLPSLVGALEGMLYADDNVSRLRELHFEKCKGNIETARSRGLVPNEEAEILDVILDGGLDQGDAIARSVRYLRWRASLSPVDVTPLSDDPISSIQAIPLLLYLKYGDASGLVEYLRICHRDSNSARIMFKSEEAWPDPALIEYRMLSVIRYVMRNMEDRVIRGQKYVDESFTRTMAGLRRDYPNEKCVSQLVDEYIFLSDSHVNVAREIARSGYSDAGKGWVGMLLEYVDACLLDHHDPAGVVVRVQRAYGDEAADAVAMVYIEHYAEGIRNGGAVATSILVAVARMDMPRSVGMIQEHCRQNAGLRNEWNKIVFKVAEELVAKASHVGSLNVGENGQAGE